MYLMFHNSHIHRFLIPLSLILASATSAPPTIIRAGADRSGVTATSSFPRGISVWGGARHSIALMSDGTVWDWGLNAWGMLGDGTTSVWPTDFVNDRHLPIQVHGPGNVGYLNSMTAIMGGETHNFALKSDGTVW